ncbi:unnamed protein product [Caenorhabditis angaria]|uniref:BPTI/Kunitz inhibitor domain-containing protein n=1 Tax=Caenorhabditis angaria TaxID=860376 RepID=A0A9P1IW09_9PELO|nr:unnamed protein product [Caenorhabditis angaria]
MLKILSLILLTGYISQADSVNCHLPKDTGNNCDSSPITLKFYFDRHTNVCQPLFYRGCSGNENRFNSRDECNKACVPSMMQKPKKADVKKTEEKNEEEISDEDEEDENENDSGKDMTLVVNQCKLLTDAKIFDKAKTCDKGCGVGWKCNKNNYCCPYKDVVCNMPASSGSESIAFKHYGRYAYQPGLKNCIRFSYFGVGGNFNNFLTYNDCKKYCMK